MMTIILMILSMTDTISFKLFLQESPPHDDEYVNSDDNRYTKSE